MIRLAALLFASNLTAQDEYRRLLKDSAITHPVEVRPLTLVLLSHALLNDKALWAAVGLASDRDTFYDAPKGLLFAVSDKAYAEKQLRYSVAIHLCPLQIKNATCIELAEKFEKNNKVDFLP